MTTELWILVVVVLILAIAATGWLRYRYGRRRRSNGHVAAPASPASVVPPPAEPLLPAGDDEAGPTEHEVLMRLHALAFDDASAGGRPADASDPMHKKVIGFVGAQLNRAEPGSDHAPRRPSLLPELIEAVHNEDASVHDIGAIIARDPALVGNLLRIANSALYRVRRQPIESIDRAVVLIGIDGMRHLIAVALMQPVLGSGRGVLDRMPVIIWQHAQLAAVAAAMHARHMGRRDAFRAQILGLVHGLGTIMVVQTARDGYAKHASLRPNVDVINALLERWAAPIAQRLAKDWELSADVASALGDQQRDVPPDELGPLARSLRVGRAAGAAAMLHGHGELEADAVLSLLQRISVPRDVAEQIWERLANAVPETVRA